MRSGVAVLVALGAIAAARHALADETREAFGVRHSPSAATCPDARALADEVARLTAKVTLDPELADAQERIDVSFTRAGATFRAEIRAKGSRAGVRVLSHGGAACTELSRAVAISLAVLLDPEWRPPEPPPPHAEPPPSPPRAAPTEEPARPSPPPPTASSPVAFHTDVTAGVALGLVRSAAPIFAIDLALTPIPQLAFVLGGILVPKQSLPLAPGHVDVRLLGGEAMACYLPLLRPITLAACGGATLASVQASGVGYFREGSGSRPLFAIGGAAIAGGDLVGPLGWTARAGALVPTSSEAFGVDGAGVAYDPPRVAIVLAAGLRVTFR